jgi:SAM-dependent methyltransferase
MSGWSLAQSFDHEVLQYERGRPGWPPQVVDIASTPSDATVIDLGAGTGKLTRLLTGRFAKVIAIEPLEGMRQLLTVVAPEAEAVAASAEALPLPDAAVDAVFCAEAFHWFEGEQALAEIARVLRPRGALILMWNIQTAPTAPSIAEAAAIVNERGHSDRQIERYESGAWRATFDGAPFDELRAATFEHVQALDAEGILAHLLSMSWVAVLPSDERAQLAADLRPLLNAPNYQRRFRTDVYWTRLNDKT